MEILQTLALLVASRLPRLPGGSIEDDAQCLEPHDLPVDGSLGVGCAISSDEAIVYHLVD